MAGGLLPVQSFLDRCDKRTVAQQVSDADAAADPDALASNTVLAAILRSASGKTATILTAWGRWTYQDLANLSGDQQAYLWDLIAREAQTLLHQRRPDVKVIDPEFVRELRFEQLALQVGDRSLE